MALMSHDQVPSSQLDPFDPNLEPVVAILRRLPGRPHRAAATRWAQQGRRTLRVGRQLYTTADEMRRFLASRQDARHPANKDKSPPVGEEAMAALDAACANAGL